MRLIGVVLLVASLGYSGASDAACVTRTIDEPPPTLVHGAPSSVSPVIARLWRHTVVTPGRQRAGWVRLTGPADGWVVNTSTQFWCGDSVHLDYPQALLDLQRDGRAGDQVATNRLALAFASGVKDGPGDIFGTGAELSAIMAVHPRLVARSLDGLTDIQARSLLHAAFNSDPDPNSAGRWAFDVVVAEPAFVTSTARRVWPTNREP